MSFSDKIATKVNEHVDNALASRVGEALEERMRAFMEGLVRAADADLRDALSDVRRLLAELRGEVKVITPADVDRRSDVWSNSNPSPLMREYAALRVADAVEEAKKEWIQNVALGKIDYRERAAIETARRKRRRK